MYLPQLGEGDKDALRATFACVVYFDQPILGAAFRAVDLQGPNTAADPRLFRLLREYAEERLADQVEQRSTSERLIHALRNLEDVSDASAEHLACLLGLGVRTLHRRLQAEGSSYRQIFEEFRRQRCLAQLSVSSSSAKRIAFSLGFANPASFHRAFRRWTGQTVSAFRGRTPEEPCLARKQDAS